VKRAEIRKRTGAALAALGYLREWMNWPKHKPGRLYLLMSCDAGGEQITEHRLAAPMTQKAWRAWLKTIPRRGPSIVYPSITLETWRQPDLEALWACDAIPLPPAPRGYGHVDVRGHKADSYGPPVRGKPKGEGR